MQVLFRRRIKASDRPYKHKASPTTAAIKQRQNRFDAPAFRLMNLLGRNPHKA